MAGALTAEGALAAVSTIHSPVATHEQRAAANAYCDQIKAHPEAALPIADQLVAPTAPDTARHFGLSLFGAVIEQRWHRPGFEAQQAEIKARILQLMAAGSGAEPGYVKEKLCGLLSAVGCREWPQRWPDMFDKIFEIGAMGRGQAELAIVALRLVGEDIMEFNEKLESRRRSDLSQALKLALPKVLPMVRGLIADSHAALCAARQGGAAGLEEAQSCERLLGAGLNLLQSWVGGVLATHLPYTHGLVPLCVTLVDEPATRVRACECVFLLAQRPIAKMGTGKGEDEVNTAMIEDAKGQLRALIAHLSAAELGAPEVLLLPENEQQYLFTKRVAMLIATVGDNQLPIFDPPGRAQEQQQQELDGKLTPAALAGPSWRG